MKKINYKYTYIYNDSKLPILSGLIKDTTKLLKNINKYNLYDYSYVHIFEHDENSSKLIHLKTVDLSNEPVKVVKAFNYRIG